MSEKSVIVFFLTMASGQPGQPVSAAAGVLNIFTLKSRFKAAMPLLV